MKKGYALINTVVIALVIFWNYYSNTGNIGSATVGELSDKYANLFTPAGYAFAIWGIIFLGLIVLAVNQLRLAFSNNQTDDSIERIGPWLILANIGNGAWLWFWLNEQTGISVLVMFTILFSLMQAVLRLGIGSRKVANSTLVATWWPIGIYTGWISVATIANITAYLAKIEWSFLFTELQWTFIMISIAAILNLFMVLKKNMTSFGVVGIWALTAIAAKHWNQIELIQWTAISWTVLLTASILVQKVKQFKAE
jgi:hypothetical protein